MSDNKKLIKSLGAVTAISAATFATGVSADEILEVEMPAPEVADVVQFQTEEERDHNMDLVMLHQEEMSKQLLEESLTQEQEIYDVYVERLDKELDRIVLLENGGGQIEDQLQEQEIYVERLDKELDSIVNELDGIVDDSDRELHDDVNRLSNGIEQKEKELVDVNNELSRKEQDLDALSNKDKLDQQIDDKEKEINDISIELDGLTHRLKEEETNRDNFKRESETKLKDLQRKLDQSGDEYITDRTQEKLVYRSGSMRGHSDEVWNRTGKKHEQVRFTGDREVVIELTDEQVEHYKKTGRINYVMNEDRVEEFFFQYLNEIRRNNGIDIPISRSNEASDFARRRARENANANRLTHDTRLSDANQRRFENAGQTMNDAFIQSDEEMAYHLAWRWFSDYNNVAGVSGSDGGYGHRNLLLTGYAKGIGLGVYRHPQTKSLHYIMTGYGRGEYNPNVHDKEIKIELDRSNNQSLVVNGRRTPTKFMDALSFRYVIKGYSDTRINPEYTRAKQELDQYQSQVDRRMKQYNDTVKTLSDVKNSRTVELKRLQGELNSLTTARDNDKIVSDELTKEIGTLKTRRDTLQGEITTLKEQLSNTYDLLNDNRYEELISRQAELVAERQQVLMDKTVNLHALSGIQTQLIVLNETRDQLRQGIDASQERLTKLTETIGDVDREIGRLSENIRRYEERQAFVAAFTGVNA